MNNFSMIKYLFIFAIIFGKCSYCEIKPDASQAYISLILGQVSIQKSGDDQWSRARMNQAINQNDEIRCEKKSRCEIKIGKKKVLRIGELTSIIIKDQIDEPEIEVRSGQIWLNIILDGKKLNLRTPTSVASIRGTIYRADADINASQFRVYEGEVGISPLGDDGEIIPDSLFVIGLGQEFVIANDAGKYLQQDKEKREQFIEDDRSMFEKFLRQEAQKLEEFKSTDLKDFKKFQSYQIIQRSFDPELDQKDEWVKWNQELDKNVKR